MDLICMVFLAYNNAMRAKRKGQNAWLWGFISAITFLFFWTIGLLFVMLTFYRGTLSQTALKAFYEQHPIHAIFIFAAGVGGYLLIRYILERMKPLSPKP